MNQLGQIVVETKVTEEATWLRRAQDGDAEAFCQLSEIYQGRLLRQAFMLCGDQALAEDVAQEALFQSWKCLRRFDGRCQFFTWLCAILLNCHRKSCRHKTPISFSSLNVENESGLPDVMQNAEMDGPDPGEVALIREESELLLSCVNTLPEKQQQVIYLRFYVDNSLENIALALGCSLGTVKSRLFNALEKLRAMPALHKHFAQEKSANNFL